MLSQKYGRTYHYPFSPGTTSDDRINSTYWEDIRQIKTLLHTEKLDGENNCLNRLGVFARSHAAPTTSPWTRQLREQWEWMKKDLGNLELFGENLYAVHSIEYERLESYFYLFAIRNKDMWLSWEEVKFYASLFDFPVVPELAVQSVNGLTEERNREQVIAFASEPGVFGTTDVRTGCPCTREGVVSRNMNEYRVADFARNVFKYVRKGHVSTDQHWTRDWKRAKLVWELESLHHSKKQHDGK